MTRLSERRRRLKKIKRIDHRLCALCGARYKIESGLVRCSDERCGHTPGTHIPNHRRIVEMGWVQQPKEADPDNPTESLPFPKGQRNATLKI